jgi:hypothetical protein
VVRGSKGRNANTRCRDLDAISIQDLGFSRRVEEHTGAHTPAPVRYKHQLQLPVVPCNVRYGMRTKREQTAQTLGFKIRI